MAATKTKQPEAQQEPKVIKPAELADALGVDPKSVRAFLRANFPRKAEEKNTSWAVSEEAAKAVIEHFSPAEDSDSEDDES